MLTNDLTEDVLEECVEKKADLIVSYHPPLFRPFKRLTQDNWKVRTLPWSELRSICKDCTIPEPAQLPGTYRIAGFVMCLLTSSYYSMPVQYGN